MGVSVSFGSGAVAALLLLCMIGIWASGKLVDMVSLLIAVCTGLFLTLTAAGELDEVMLFLTVLTKLPFCRQFLQLSGTPGIAASVTATFTAFAGELLKLFLLCVGTSITLELAKPLESACKEVPIKWLRFLLIWLLRMIACVTGMCLFFMLSEYALPKISQGLLAGISCSVFLALLLMLLSPVVEFLVLSAKVIPNAFLIRLSKFVSENKMGGKLQASFYATLSLTLILALVQQANVFAAERDMLRSIIEALAYT